MKNYQKQIILAVILVGLVVGITYAVKPRQLPFYGELVQTNERIRHNPVVLSDYIRYPGEDGKNALELLRSQQGVTAEVKQYDFGAFIESINGARPDDKHFWKLYVNGQASQVGADQLVTKRGDILEWVLEEIEDNS
ncbi:MAG: DUF4430 domain-containing protein [Candidatus Doudnabacteria bacterium]|nr:DUF4430 domain-containing protein [bacterium]MDZ4244179.1 DUF4430 domain-containing protein [Candidatus Doudnabacteria bacterium]